MDRAVGDRSEVPREPSDRCPFIHRNQMALCEAHHSVSFEPGDAYGRSLPAALTCSFLTVGQLPGRYYPRCALGDEKARQAESDRRRAELYLRVSQALHAPRGPGEIGNAGVMLADDDGRYVTVNKSMCKMLGLDRADLIGKTVWDLTPPPHDPNGRAMWRSFIAAGEGFGSYALAGSGDRILRFDYIARANVKPGLHMSILTPAETPRNQGIGATARDGVR